jgi:hypothetical protein
MFKFWYLRALQFNTKGLPIELIISSFTVNPYFTKGYGNFTMGIYDDFIADLKNHVFCFSPGDHR